MGYVTAYFLGRAARAWAGGVAPAEDLAVLLSAV